jgi:hypothetical protein
MKSGARLIIVYAAMVGAFAAMRLWWWVWTWLLVGLVVGAVELVAKARTGRTISQQFQAFHRAHPWRAALLVAAMLGFVLWLVIGHLWIGW